MYRVILSLEAQSDIEEATDYYLSVGLDVAGKFIDKLEILYEELRQNPQHYSFIDKDKNLRSASFINYPYSIIFQIQDDVVYVFAIYNTDQSPGKLFKRIQ